jgi:hypothetical protein
VSTVRKASLRAVAAPIYQLRVDLKHIEPAIWRRLVVPGSIKLSKLHAVLQAVMGWHGGHLHEFIVGPTHYGTPDPHWPDATPVLREDRATLAAALGGLKTFTYLYDFGDGWEHKIKVEKILAPDRPLARPFCIVGANACPPEDVGGPPGYCEFLQAISDAGHDEHASMLEWCGGAFDPAAFDIDAVNERLADIRL